VQFKPMKRKAYEKWIGGYGWQLVKAGSGDYKLVDAAGNVMKPFVKVTHPGGEVIPKHVKDTENLLKLEGLL
jgi:hypothetical protein